MVHRCPSELETIAASLRNRSNLDKRGHRGVEPLALTLSCCFLPASEFQVWPASSRVAAASQEIRVRPGLPRRYRYSRSRERTATAEVPFRLRNWLHP